MNDELARQRKAVNEGVLLLDAKELGVLVVRGADRKAWLNGLVTCDLAPLRPGDGAFGLAVGKTGKLLAELWLALGDDAIRVALPRQLVPSILAHFDRHLVMEDVTLEEASDALSVVVAHGPRSEEAVAAARAHGAHAAKADRTGKGGAVVFLEMGRSKEVFEAMGSALSDATAWATAAGWDALSVELGVGRFGVDYGPENYPQEASLEKVGVSFSKGCYLGQEAVFMLEKRGHAKKRLVRLVVEGGDALAHGAKLVAGDGAEAGELVRTTPAPSGETLALAYVKWKHLGGGEALTVNGRAARIA